MAFALVGAPIPSAQAFGHSVRLQPSIRYPKYPISGYGKTPMTTEASGPRPGTGSRTSGGVRRVWFRPRRRAGGVATGFRLPRQES